MRNNPLTKTKAWIAQAENAVIQAEKGPTPTPSFKKF
jgi:hypothetical protein